MIKTESGDIAATGSMTAYFMEQSEQEGDDATKKTIDLPATSDTKIIDKATYPKHPATTIALRY